MKKKRSITLIELLIVILLIGIIGGALAFNMKGSLDKGKVFKTEEGMRTVKDILYLEMANSGRSIDDVVANWSTIVDTSPLAGKPEQLKKDGWGYTYTVAVKGDDIEITSPGLTQKNAQTK